ncbi:MAG: NAD(P)(+) transhydrogenase [Acidobacteria bacterium RIFCSPLOWO2_12_FULL_65_11]|nr:MAG: NAD(P)(+) transhydrogenase [Acidobacteria bacterium RIFCSPLOWO2_02_FULL_64_15]OFW31442.1 MAG: NAD(P)(+) transhydrogenase [Acidobacteria bacterium RIFCSPLOWO2_12_FULL_65_11]
MSEKHVFDVVVIGSGPGGEGAAMRSVKNGRSVAVVEDLPRVGGNCTHFGTIPSKALRQAIQQLMEFKTSPLFKEAAAEYVADFPLLLKAADAVIEQQVAVRAAHFERNKVRLVHGKARFLNANEVEVTDKKGARETLAAKAFIVAVGAHPYHPADVDFSHPRVVDYDTVLDLKETPRTLTIYGAGTIGCEYASIFRNLDVKINLVNTQDKLLTFLDDEIVDALSYHLRDQGVLIRHNEECAKVEPREDGVVLHLKSGKQLKTDYLLWANGRTGNTEGLGLDALGVEIDSRGYIKVDAGYRSAVPHIYAVGDVVGAPSLASAAYDQGRFAAGHILHGESDESLIANIPTGIYTVPEISSIGRTERELTEQKVPYEVGHAAFRHLARAEITGRTVGMLKLLFHRDTLEILGVHCFGDQASEIVHIGQVVMSQKGEANSVEYFTKTTFNYPTMAEAYRVAALNGLNRLARGNS